MPHSTAPPDSARERLARLEVRLDQLVAQSTQTHADLRENIEWQRRIHEQHELRFSALEQSTHETRTHLNWMKAIWAAVQATVIGWFSTK